MRALCDRSEVTVKQINRSSKLPLYYQLHEILQGMIRAGEWQPGDMIPPESELIKRYKVSRTTVRQVLDLLVNEGLIFRQRGRGTFVSHPTVEKALVRILSFTEDMRRRGVTPSTRVLSSSLISAPRDIADRLEIEAGEELARLERLRLADCEPMSIEESYLVHRYCQGVLRGDYASHPLRQALEEEHGVRLVRAKQVIRAIVAPRRLVNLLLVPSGSALLFIERVSYSEQDVPIEFLRIYYRGDRYTLHNELHD
jgi:GntR family transcriptional regulator